MHVYNLLGWTQRKYLVPLSIKPKTFGLNSPSHKGRFEHAIDLKVPDPNVLRIDVLAPSEGKIIYLEQRHSIWGPNPTFAKFTNFLTVQTPWGEFWELAHIEKESCPFKYGDKISEGDVVAKTDVNGWMTEENGIPDFHLHFLVGFWTNNSSRFKSLRIRYKNWEAG